MGVPISLLVSGKRVALSYLVQRSVLLSSVILCMCYTTCCADCMSCSKVRSASRVDEAFLPPN